MSDELISRVTGVIAKTQKIPPETVTIDKSFEELKRLLDSVAAGAPVELTIF